MFFSGSMSMREEVSMVGGNGLVFNMMDDVIFVNFGEDYIFIFFMIVIIVVMIVGNIFVV